MAANRSDADLSGKRILVVEDEGIVAFWVSEVLTSAGASVIGPAASVREALALLENGAVDGAVLDYKLQSDTTAAVADLLAAKGVPFVFATGYDGTAIEARHAGRPRLEKAFAAEELIFVLRSTLDRNLAE